MYAIAKIGDLDSQCIRAFRPRISEKMEKKQELEQAVEDKETQLDEYEQLLAEYHDFVTDLWAQCDELRMKIVKKMWDYTGKPLPKNLKKKFEDYGLLEASK